MHQVCRRPEHRLQQQQMAQRVLDLAQAAAVVQMLLAQQLCGARGLLQGQGTGLQEAGSGRVPPARVLWVVLQAAAHQQQLVTQARRGQWEAAWGAMARRGMGAAGLRAAAVQVGWTPLPGPAHTTCMGA